MDTKDLALIEALRRDGRAPIRELAARTNMRPSTVHARLKKLVTSGVIERFTVKLNNASVGENFIVFVLVTTEGTIPDKVFKNPSIKGVFGITGEYDLLLKLKVANIEEFNSFILGFRELPQVKRTHTLVVTINLKEEP